ncbi:MAG TPA: aldehyde dehydrogenase family protein, partial [Phycisphaerales bacterium]|nr:aldehyde dehydrogenase family protein [Phycisphaerales bacterium]
GPALRAGSSAPSPSGRGQGEGFGSSTSSSPESLSSASASRHQLSPAIPNFADNLPFLSEPFREFSDRATRETFAAAVAKASVPRIANDKTPADAARAVERAHAFFPAWRDTEPRDRAAMLIRAAEIMRQRRDELSAVMIKESGKTWREADADTCEAIDFCEYYAREAIPLFEPKRLGRFTGELNEQWHQPRGVAVVISPWNFPLAICCGMTAAALVTGNTVVVKPAEQTPGIAAILAEILWQAGIPKDALHFMPAPGETTGAALVRDPRVALIAFTGSRDVGLDILNAAAPPSPFASHSAPSPSGRGQGEGFGSSPSSLSSSSSSSSSSSFSGPRSPVPGPSLSRIKHVVCEMGGKNAIIIDESADLDEAVLAVRKSAFGFQGQKCSACSRVIVLDAVHDHFVERLVESTKALVIGDPTKPGTDVGPVIDAEAAQKINSYIARGKAQSTLALAMDPPPTITGASSASASQPSPSGRGQGEGSGSSTPSSPPSSASFVPPHIFTNVHPDHDIARDEIFGPVLAVIRVKDFDEALRVANDSPYKLTGGVFSRKPSNLTRAKREFRVGNLYLNRGITGALVGRQPFGGFGMSGLGSKAGGDEYLQHFVEPRIFTENTMRRGFAPEM